MNRIRYAVPVAALFLVVPTARAQTLPDDARFELAWFANGAEVLSSTLSVETQTSFTLQVFLRQKEGSTNVLASEGGLFGGGVRATYGAPSGTAGVISVASVNDVVYNPQFNDTVTSNPTRVVTPDYAQFRAASDASQAATPDLTGKVLLGSFTFQATGLAGQSTTLTAARVPNLDSIVTYNNFFALDNVTSADSLTVQLIAPVPEPGLTLGCVLLALGVTRAIRRRRRETQVALNATLGD